MFWYVPYSHRVLEKQSGLCFCSEGYPGGTHLWPDGESPTPFPRRDQSPCLEVAPGQVDSQSSEHSMDYRLRQSDWVLATPGYERGLTQPSSPADHAHFQA